MNYLLLMCLCVLPLAADDLPDWAEAAVAEAAGATPPDQGVWVLFDETAVVLQEDGRFRQRRRVVRRVIGGSGRNAGIFVVDGDIETTRIKKLRGWHRTRDGLLRKLDRDNVVAIGRADIISTDLRTLAGFGGVFEGSIVAFESDELIDSYFPTYPLSLASAEPVLKRVISLDAAGHGTASLVPVGLGDGQGAHIVEANRLTLRNLPALEDEALSPDHYNAYPYVLVQLQPKGSDNFMRDWSAFAAHYYGVFAQKAWSKGIPAGDNDPQGLLETIGRVQEAIAYRQVYLTAARGYEPRPAAEVLSLAYGDCKDMVSCLTGLLRRQNFETFPTLAAIGGSVLPHPDMPVQPAFDHLITAVRLPQSLGLAAEVEVNGSRYLLSDPTDAHTPAGKLNAAYRGRYVLICLPDGGAWVQIPDAALSDWGVQLNLTGRLDRDWHFRGAMEVHEQGNAWYLQGALGDGNTRDLDARLARMLRLPGSVVLQRQAANVDKDGSVSLIYTVSWPMFLTPDLGGRRLPYGLTGRPLAALTRAGAARVAPVYRAGRAPVRLHLEMALPAPLYAGRDQARHEDAYGSFVWKATDGDKVTADLTVVQDTVDLPRAKTDEAQAWYADYRAAWHAFLAAGPVFYTQPAAGTP